MSWKATEQGSESVGIFGKSVAQNQSQGDKDTVLGSLLSADIDATTLFRMTSDLSLPFCATHFRGKA
jgi:hypothetical protein